VVVTGCISGAGNQKRIVIKAIDVLTSRILSMVSAGLQRTLQKYRPAQKVC